jgi:hypothetical protein
MEWQGIIVGLLIALACAYLARRGWRAWQASQRGCGGGCGCASSNTESQAAPTLIPSDQLRLRNKTV